MMWASAYPPPPPFSPLISLASATSAACQNHKPPATQSATRCLVWSSPDRALPPSVRQSLLRQQVRLTEVDSAVTLMLQLALEPTHLLLIVSPASIDDLPTVITAIDRYYPKLVCWQCSTLANGQLHLGRLESNGSCPALSLPTSPSSPADSHFSRSSAQHDPIKPSRRIPYPGIKARPPARKSPAPLDAGPLLTRQELDMLLNSDSAMRVSPSPLSDRCETDDDDGL